MTKEKVMRHSSRTSRPDPKLSGLTDTSHRRDLTYLCPSPLRVERDRVPYLTRRGPMVTQTEPRKIPFMSYSLVEESRSTPSPCLYTLRSS